MTSQTETGATPGQLAQWRALGDAYLREHPAEDLQDLAMAAASWWAERLTGMVVYQGTTPEERAWASKEPEQRDAYRDYDMGLMLAEAMANKVPVPDEQQARAFTVDLGTKIFKALEDGVIRHVEELRVSGEARPPYFGIDLGVDYHPSRALADSAGAAGISAARFPIKTNMWLSVDHVTAAPGYGSPSRLVHAVPGWERPRCGQRHYRDLGGGDYDRLPEVCGKEMYHADREHGDWQPVEVCHGPARRDGEICNEEADHWAHRPGSGMRDHEFQPKEEVDA